MNEKKYKNYCVHCEKVYDDISNYFCIKNTGACGSCFPNKKNKPRKINYGITDLFSKYRESVYKKCVDKS